MQQTLLFALAVLTALLMTRANGETTDKDEKDYAAEQASRCVETTREAATIIAEYYVNGEVRLGQMYASRLPVSAGIAAGAAAGGAVGAAVDLAVQKSGAIKYRTAMSEYLRLTFERCMLTGQLEQM